MKTEQQLQSEIESLRAQLDDESDALTVAYMHGFNKGKSIGSQLAALVPDVRRDDYELIMKWADIYAAQTGNLYAEAVQDPSKAACMADERTMLGCVVVQALSAPSQQAPVAQGEPVAVIDADGGGWFLNWKVPMHTLPLFTRLYTHPQQASEPMTPEQAAEIAKQLGWDSMPGSFPLIIRAVERHHNIKGKQ